MSLETDHAYGMMSMMTSLIHYEQSRDAGWGPRTIRYESVRQATPLARDFVDLQGLMLVQPAKRTSGEPENFYLCPSLS
jgi:hypothetical protein